MTPPLNAAQADEIARIVNEYDTEAAEKAVRSLEAIASGQHLVIDRATLEAVRAYIFGAPRQSRKELLTALDSVLAQLPEKPQ